MRTATHDQEKHKMPFQSIRRLWAWTLAVAATAVLLSTPTAAQAGEYPQHFCASGPGSFTQNAWYGVGSPHPNAFCTRDVSYPFNGVHFDAQTLPLNGYGGLRSDAPSGARYKDINLNLRVPYQAQNRRTFIEANSRYVFDWWNGWGGSSSYNSSGNFFTVNLGNSSYFVIGQACHGASSAGCEAGDFYFSGAQATLVDTKAPVVAAHTDRGLFDAGRDHFRGVVPVAADIHDDGHGPAAAHVEVDAAEVPGSRENFLGACNYRSSNPCPSRIRWTRDVNTAAYPDGVRTVKVVGDDGVGQAAFAQRTVTFDNTAPVMGEMPAVNGKTVSADQAQIAVSATDATSGIDRIEAMVDGGPWAAIRGGELVVTGAGSHEVRFRAVDRAGNVSPEQVVSFTLQIAPDNQRIVTAEDQPLPGAPGPGDVVKCDVGGPWSGGTAFEYRWLVDGAPIDGAIDQTYTVVAADAGKQLSCRVLARNEAGTTQRVTSPVTVGSARCFGQTAPTQRCGDFDRDGEENHTDTDDDNDGVPDGQDPAPFDPNVPGTGGSGSGGSGAGAASAGAGAGGRETSAAPYVGPPNNGINASNHAKITVEGARKRTVKFGRRIATVAHLRDENGRPIVGATVTVLERMNVPGAEWVPAREPLVSDAQGRLRWIIPARFSRTIRYAYKANLRNTEFQSTSEVTLIVFSRSTLKASRSIARNGQTVVFRGSLLSRPLPPGGVLIDLQARVGKRWQTFRTARARGTNGRWKMAYRFRSTRGVQVYAFRARVRQDSGYPYALSTTRPIRVKVIG